MQNDINLIIDRALTDRVSDIHFKSNGSIFFRDKDGILIRQGEELSQTEIKVFCLEILKEERVEKTTRELIEMDGSADLPYRNGFVHVRYNVFEDRFGLSVAIRNFKTEIPRMEDLRLPEPVQQQRTKDQGLILFCGATGSGKTTALYSMVNAINMESVKHIITLEDPTEYILSNGRSAVSQREIGQHCDCFASGLKSSLREDPDVIVVGEMRDRNTIATCLQAAETGHLVFSTIHAGRIEEVLDRILQYFPAEEHRQRRNELANSFHAIIGCSLFPRRDGGRIAAYETLLKTTATTAILRDGQISQIYDYMKASNGMQSRTMAIEKLVAEELIDLNLVTLDL